MQKKKLLIGCIVLVLVLVVAGVMADVPLAAVYMQSIYMVLWLVFAYVLLMVFYRKAC